MKIITQDAATVILILQNLIKRKQSTHATSVDDAPLPSEKNKNCFKTEHNVCAKFLAYGDDATKSMTNFIPHRCENSWDSVAKEMIQKFTAGRGTQIAHGIANLFLMDLCCLKHNENCNYNISMFCKTQTGFEKEMWKTVDVISPILHTNYDKCAKN